MNVPNMQQILKQAQKMQEQLQKQMEDLVVEASAGGGMVSVRMNGQKLLLSVAIDPEALNANDREMVQDLVLAAVNEAGRKVDEQLQGQMGSLAGGLKIPGLFES
ncbi:MAG: YbaB/EbfC family nucleoid-associated protein [Acidobacteriia bacterium]|nr:YbaB/EbfC family nucleoid-associated protein [Terriglobia bacterium]